ASPAGLLGPPPTENAEPPAWAPHEMPSSRPASRCASRMRTSRLTCWPPTKVMVLTTAGLPYWPTMSSTFCIELASVTVPESSTRTLELGTAARIALDMPLVSAPTSTASRPTGAPEAENRLTVVVPNDLPTRYSDLSVIGCASAMLGSAETILPTASEMTTVTACETGSLIRITEVLDRS